MGGAGVRRESAHEALRAIARARQVVPVEQSWLQDKRTVDGRTSPAVESWKRETAEVITEVDGSGN